MKPFAYVQSDLPLQKRKEIDFIFWMVTVTLLLITILLFCLIGILSITITTIPIIYTTRLLIKNNSLGLKQEKEEKHGKTK